MELRKLETYEENQRRYSKRVYLEYENILNKTDDKLLIESIRNLAEMTYKEGLRDGLRFMDWLTDCTN